MKEMEFLYDQKQPPEVFYKKVVLKNFVKFAEKPLGWNLFFNKVAGLRLKVSSKFLYILQLNLTNIPFKRGPVCMQHISE